MQATRYGRVDFADDCDTSVSSLGGAATSFGGRAVQHSHWNGFDLTTKAGTDKLKEDLLETRPRVVWMTPPSTTQRKQQSQSRSNIHRIQMKFWTFFSSLWSKTGVRRFQNRCGVRRVLVVAVPFQCGKEQFHSGRTPGCQWRSLADGTLSSKSCHIDVGQICCVPDDVFMIILIKHWRKKRCSTHRSKSRQL